MIKTEIAPSKQVTASSHFPSSERYIGGLIEKFSNGLVSLKSSVSCDYIFVCLISVSVCFFYKKLSIQYSFYLKSLNLSSVISSLNFSLVFDSLILEAFLFPVFVLLSLSFQKGGACSLCEWSFLLMYLTR